MTWLRGVLKRWYVRLRFGKLTAVERGTVAGVTCEIEYRNAKGAVVGYWAYGYFDPRYPYQGDE